RCIDAIHREWCYRRLPPEVLLHFMALANQKDNPRRSSCTQQCIWQCNGRASYHSDIPRPFTTFLLASAFSTALKQLLAFRTRVQPL
ncbi:hypothetical protein BDZ97DRAFT_1651863, partial [Flammula alnicola]